MTKPELRQQLRARVRAITPEQRTAFSLAACERLRQQCVFGDARAILFYSALTDELDLSPLIAEALTAGCRIALPRFVPETGAYDAFEITHATEHTAQGVFKIHEPIASCPVFPLNRLDLVLVPGVGFDPVGHRLGRGRGFYDRLLFSASGLKCGVAFDQQLVPEIPVEPHDIKLNCLLTPSTWFDLDR